MNTFKSTKLFDGYSACFRQWKADGTHCKFLHGYAVSFRVWFEGDLDHRNWVFDFGGMKRAKTKMNGMSPKDYFAYLLDHTTIVAEDDPYLEQFKQMDKDGIIQLRILPSVGCERFAEFLYNKINEFLHVETQGRVQATKIEVYEHERNSASYEEAKSSSNEFMSLYDFLGIPAGPSLGKQVAQEASLMGIEYKTKQITTPNYSGEIMMYPIGFLESYFYNHPHSYNNPATDELPF